MPPPNPDTLIVDLHCHSSCSDGTFPPEQVAQLCAEANVAWAALADHNTLEGQQAFHTALTAHSIGFVSAVELSCFCERYDLHILGYGFDGKAKEIVSLVGKYKYGTSAVQGGETVVTSAAAIQAIHAAGGIAVVAHPLLAEADLEKLFRLIDQLRKEGLDGIEINGNACEHADAFIAYAENHGLCMAMGTDFHGNGKYGQPVPGIACPRQYCDRFRDALLSAARKHAAAYTLVDPSVAQPLPGNPPSTRWLPFMIHIVTPVSTVMALFIGALFLVILPMFENALIERKREMIRELTNTAVSILDDAYRKYENGALSEVEAKALGSGQVSHLRYGATGKDYFWIQDCHPRMIMHPYRHDLDGKDLSEVTDRGGVFIFKKFARLVEQHDDGYMQYVWQWMDNPQRVEPKESYLRLFKPWRWIVGTGIYLHDVREEIDRYRMRLSLICSAIGLCALLLLVYALRKILQLEQKRRASEKSLAESTERYRLLVDTATEGALFIFGNRCRYANAAMLTYIGCTEQTVELFTVDTVFPPVEDNVRLLELLTSDVGTVPDTLPGKMKRGDGVLVDCAVTVKGIPGATSGSKMVLVRHLEQVGPFSRKKAVSVTLEKMFRISPDIPNDHLKEIQIASDILAIEAVCRKTPALVRTFLDNGASPVAIAAMLSETGNAAARRLVQMAIERFGKPPRPFAFCVLGSQGRHEQTIFTDQDNIIIYDAEKEEPAAVRYFGELGEFVCHGLVKCGYHACGGDVMATNPKWCQPLAVWKAYFSHWISSATPHELMELSAFLDFSPVAGESRLATELREYIFTVLEQSPSFYPVFAQHALEFKPPLRLFGKMVTPALPKEQHGKIDLKAISMPIVSFLRLYALKHSVCETNSMERLTALTNRGMFLESKRQDIAATWESLLLLRLRHQVETVERGEPIDNWIDPAWPGHIGVAVLRECFKEIDSMQKLIRRDFLADG